MPLARSVPGPAPQGAGWGQEGLPHAQLNLDGRATLERAGGRGARSAEGLGILGAVLAREC